MGEKNNGQISITTAIRQITRETHQIIMRHNLNNTAYVQYNNALSKYTYIVALLKIVL